MPRPSPITADYFPVPRLLLRTNDPAAQQLTRAFAAQQADAARHLHQTLTAADAAAGFPARAAAFTTAFEQAENWRSRAAAASAHPDGRYSQTYADRFRTLVTDTSPNLLRIGSGEDARLRDGAVWNPQTRTYQGGEETPASRTMRHIGELAETRFTEPGVDVVHTRVSLTGNQTAEGMRLLRAAAARRAAANLAARIAARGRDPSRIATDGHLIYLATSPTADRTAIFTHAMALLAQDHATPADALTAWVHAAYLLYQAPRRKRGADATTRTFLVAAGAHLLGHPPVLLHDVDLRALVLPQAQFVFELHAAQHREVLR